MPQICRISKNRFERVGSTIKLENSKNRSRIDDQYETKLIQTHSITLKSVVLFHQVQNWSNAIRRDHQKETVPMLFRRVISILNNTVSLLSARIWYRSSLDIQCWGPALKILLIERWRFQRQHMYHKRKTIYLLAWMLSRFAVQSDCGFKVAMMSTSMLCSI